MSHNLMVETHGDPLGAIRHILKTIWRNAKLEVVLTPTNGSTEVKHAPYLLNSPDELDSFNPFRPLMTSNTARFIPDLLGSRGKARKVGAVLRPCELRALKGMEKNYQVNTEGLLTISFDCLGTYPIEDYAWRTERKGSAEQLTLEAIQFAKQGGIVPYRFRSACQVCHSPASEEAHVNIGVIGLPIRQHILLRLKEKGLEDLLTSSGLGIKLADESIVDQHNAIVAKIKERNQRVSERIRQGMADVFPMSFEQLVEAFIECGDCQKCMQVCPICAVHIPIRSASGNYLLEEIVRWAEACAGCGMCDQVCPSHRPLSAFFSYVRDQIDYDESITSTALSKPQRLH
ncbi:MAG: Coenzyme F420 hydrogenase/dehydrogenase, beta subunit C-terminal domain [Anaerolineales bacterium]|nr:Coenzyme F420 hydrogenase/dehydrogenase, beta subunit C-terminal domain [Anaerolineales bacterium]